MEYKIRYKKTENYENEIIIEVETISKGRELAEYALEEANRNGIDDAFYNAIKKKAQFDTFFNALNKYIY